MVLLKNINVTLMNAESFKSVQAQLHQAGGNAAFSVCRQDDKVLQVAAAAIVA
ncbi:hypothetical protein P368_17290 [Comamonas thiooxydans]|nr:hypothetical protein P369_14720 [Comamonas thiooxydans]KGG97244.1 hypothetical protein P367_16900 [Comamonas thiooxydans]KGH00431.1 hypothetical protein P365_21105 [Comamonas thiooxydans]KGH09880.1 hypothetical protein P368_17290 [Comamonas thiooxydans]